MKKQFANPELEIVKLNNADIIATSDGDGTGGTTGGGAWGARLSDDFEEFDE